VPQSSNPPRQVEHDDHPQHGPALLSVENESDLMINQMQKAVSATAWQAMMTTCCHS
jgi:hypothetical protein